MAQALLRYWRRYHRHWPPGEEGGQGGAHLRDMRHLKARAWGETGEAT